MRIGFFNEFVPGVIADNRVVEVSGAVRQLNHGSPSSCWRT